MKKKILIGILCFTLILSGCGSNNSSNNAANNSGDNQVYGTTNSSNDYNDYTESEPTVTSNDNSGELSEEVTTEYSEESREKTESEMDTSDWWDDDNKNVEYGFKAVSDMPLSTFSIDVDTASYSNIRRYLNDNQLPPEEMVRLEEMVNYFNYNHDLPTGNDPLGITTEIGVCPWNEDHLLAMVGLKAAELNVEDLPASNIVFLLDVSGSMNNADKLPLLKQGFSMLAEELTENDRVSIVVYAGYSGTVLEGAHGDDKDEIISAINDLNAGGSTAGAEGIQNAYSIAEKYFIKNGNNRVILATDGDFNVGISDEDDLIEFIEEKRKSGIHLSVLGFGTGDYKDSKLESLADHGNGNYAYIDSVLEAKKVMVNEMYATLFTLAKDTKLQVEFNPEHVSGYRLIGYENRMLENKDFTDDTKDAGEIGIGHTVTAFYEIIPQDDLSGQQLKYDGNKNNASNPEWMEVRVRFKKPNQSVSTEIKEPVIFVSDEASEDFAFASSVIEFGLLLKDSEFKGQADYDAVIKRAKQSKGIDDDGYRAQFIQLVEIAEALK